MLTLTILSSAAAAMGIAISARTSVRPVAIMGMVVALLIQLVNIHMHIYIHIY